MRFPTVARQHIHRPLVALHVHSAGRMTLTAALIDTGADISIFPKFVADRLRLDLSGCELGGTEHEPLRSTVGLPNARPASKPSQL